MSGLLLSIQTNVYSENIDPVGFQISSNNHPSILQFFFVYDFFIKEKISFNRYLIIKKIIKVNVLLNTKQLKTPKIETIT